MNQKRSFNALQPAKHPCFVCWFIIADRDRGAERVGRREGRGLAGQSRDLEKEKQRTADQPDVFALNTTSLWLVEISRNDPAAEGKDRSWRRVAMTTDLLLQLGVFLLQGLLFLSEGAGKHHHGDRAGTQGEARRRLALVRFLFFFRKPRNWHMHRPV